MSAQLQTFLRLKQVKILTGFSRSWIYAAIRRGDFPDSIPIGARAVAWTADSITNWQHSRIKQSRKPAGSTCQQIGA